MLELIIGIRISGDEHSWSRTDHYSLKFIMDQCLTTTLQHTWVTKLFGYDLILEYMPGKLNMVAGVLSQHDEEVFSVCALLTLMFAIGCVPSYLQKIRLWQSAPSWQLVRPRKARRRWITCCCTSDASLFRTRCPCRRRCLPMPTTRGMNGCRRHCIVGARHSSTCMHSTRCVSSCADAQHVSTMNRSIFTL